MARLRRLSMARGGEADDRAQRHGPPSPAGKRSDPAGDPDGLGGAGEVQASEGGDLQAAELHAVVTAVTGVVGDGDLRQGRLTAAGAAWAGGLHDQQVGGLRRCGVPAPAVSSGNASPVFRAGSW
jgi:hypothetical protein